MAGLRGAGTEPPAGGRSAVQEFIESNYLVSNFTHEQHLTGLAANILHNLQYQHRWTSLRIHDISPQTGKPLPRPLVSGLPPLKLYIHPDEQIELLRVQSDRKKRSTDVQTSDGLKADEADQVSHSSGEHDTFAEPEREWVLPTHLRENWSLKKFAEVFDSISIVPPLEDEEVKLPHTSAGARPNIWRTTKRVLLATMSDDSTVVYYIMHDGLVKPRQN